MSKASISARFINAPNNKKLQEKLLTFQHMRGRQLQWISIYQEKDGSVTAWFYDETPDQEIPKFSNIFKQK